jgi:CheY-like chemotaxis protein
MIYGFARQSDGFVKIGSEVGRGTTVCLFLPRHDQMQEVLVNAEQAAPADHKAHGQTVLVVEDEPLVRLLIIDLLQELGYRALEASDGPTGLRILDSPQRIDLLITDIGLPGLNGRQVADAARVTRPDLKVLFMTGYAENAVAAKGFLAPGMQIITKPFVMDVFGRRIRELMETPTSPVPWSEGARA